MSVLRGNGENASRGKWDRERPETGAQAKKLEFERAAAGHAHGRETLS